MGGTGEARGKEERQRMVMAMGGVSAWALSRVAMPSRGSRGEV